MAIHIIVEKYPNPCRPGGYGWMAHSEDIEAAGIFGFGADQQEAEQEFSRELDRVKTEE